MVLFTPFFVSAQFYSSLFNNSLPTAIDLKDIRESIYNGKQHLGYPKSIIGNPYYQTEEWQKGSIVYHDIFYPDILLKYDLVQNEVVIRNSGNDIAIALFTPRIKNFSIMGKKFFYSPGNNGSLPPPGIYEELKKGSIDFYIHRSKYIKETINGIEATREFNLNDLYYVVKDGICYPVKTQKDILHLVKEKKAEIKKDLKSKNLHFRNNIEATLSEIVSYYNKTTK